MNKLALAGETETMTTQNETRLKHMRVNYQIIESEKEALKAVEQNGYGYALRYVKDQTEAVCLKAVAQNGYALQYVKDRAMFKQIAAKFGIETDLD